MCVYTYINMLISKYIHCFVIVRALIHLINSLSITTITHSVTIPRKHRLKRLFPSTRSPSAIHTSGKTRLREGDINHYRVGILELAAEMCLLELLL